MWAIDLFTLKKIGGAFISYLRIYDSFSTFSSDREAVLKQILRKHKGGT
jgi:hypothetical protein